MTNKDMKGYLSSLVIREIHVEIKMRYSKRMAIIKKTDDTNP